MASLKTLMLFILILANYHWYYVYSFKYTIGALLSSTDTIESFKKTVSEINRNYRTNQSIFSDIIVEAKAELMATNALMAAQQVCDLIKQTDGTMFALVVSHPYEDPSMPPLSASFTCAFYHIPVIGITARQSAFSDKYSHTSFLRTVPPYSQEAQVWTDLILQFAWNEVTFIYSDDQEGKTLLSRLDRYSEEKKFRIAKSVSFQADEPENLNQNFTNILIQIKNEQTRAIILYARKEYAEKIFEAATRLKMLQKDWGWLVTEQALSATNVPLGVIGVQLAEASESDHLTDAVKVVTRGIEDAYVDTEDNNRKKFQAARSPRSCRDTPSKVTFDIIVPHKYRGRIRKKSESVSWTTFGKKIYENMTGVVLPGGKTGYVAFDKQGDRALPIYKIINIQRNGSTPVGTYGNKRIKPPNWDSKEVFLEMISINMSLLYWPGDIQFFKNKETCDNSPKPKCGTSKVPIAPISFKKKTHLKVVTKKSIPFVNVGDKIGPNDQCDEDPRSEILGKEVKCKHTDPITNEVSWYCCKGYCIDLLRRLANRTGIEDNFTPFKYDLHLVGDGQVGEEKFTNDTRKWTGIVGELISGEADLAVAPITITPERAARIEFTKPFKYLGLTILVKREQARSSLASFLQPFENTMWVLVGLSVHVVALVLYLLDRFSPFGRFKLAKSSDTEEDALNLSSAMWFAWGVLLNSGIGEGTPRSFSARVLGMVWAGFAMIIVASYTANLAAFLVLDRPEASISGIDDARLRNPQKDFTFATVKGSPVEKYFKRQVEYATMYRTMEQTNNQYLEPETAIEAVKNGRLKAFIWDSARLNYEASIECDLITAGEVFGRTGYGLAMKKDNPWLYEMSQAVLNFHERGFMEKLDTQWILVKKEGCQKTDPSPATLGLTNMAGVFIMVAAGIVAGVLLIFIEIAYKKRRGMKEKELELAKNAADRWRGNIEKRKILRKTLAAEREESLLKSGGCGSHDHKRALPQLATQNGVYFENEGQL